MNMNKVAQALRLLADAFDGTELTEGTLTTGVSGPDKEWKKPEPKPDPIGDPVGVAGMAGQVEFVPPATPNTPPATPNTPPATPNTPAQPTMTKEEFTTAMQSLGREFGQPSLHAALPALWEKYTGGVKRMSAIPADQYAEIVQFTREEIARLL